MSLYPLPSTLQDLIDDFANKLPGYLLVGNYGAIIDGLTAILQNSIASPSETVISEKGVSHVLELADRGTFIDMNVATPCTVTVPLNSTVEFPIGTLISIRQLGLGAVTLVPAGGVTLQSKDGLIIGGRYAMAALLKVGTDTWAVTGSLTT